MPPNYAKDDLGLVESGNWNVADSYAKLKIMLPLREFDENRKIARFGTIELSDEFVVSPQMKEDARLKALRRMVECLEIVIDNSLFAVTVKQGKGKLQDALVNLEKITEFLPKIEKRIVIENHKGKSQMITVNESVFELVFMALKKIHRDMLEPLNKADLIFQSIEEFDVDAFKAQVWDRAVNQG